MCSGRALTMRAIVPEYVGSTMRPSPAMTRVRSDGVAPQRAIQRRTGNQYSTASARITKSVGNITHCGQHDISAIAGACPMMYGEGADFGHTCMRWILKRHQ
jgi:hypothetical protein